MAEIDREATRREIERLRRSAIMEFINYCEAKHRGDRGLAMGCALAAEQLAQNADALAAQLEADHA